MGSDANVSITLVLTVRGCSECGGDHVKLEFSPGVGPRPVLTHYGVCPETGSMFWLDTQSVSGVWERLLKAAEAM